MREICMNRNYKNTTVGSTVQLLPTVYFKMFPLKKSTMNYIFCNSYFVTFLWCLGTYVKSVNII